MIKGAYGISNILNQSKIPPHVVVGTMSAGKSTSKHEACTAYPFMIDQFGNFICFYYDSLLDTPSIIFFNLESQKVEKIADTFEEFTSLFYEL